jgi:hypothetical protein
LMTQRELHRYTNPYIPADFILFPKIQPDQDFSIPVPQT